MEGVYVIRNYLVRMSTVHSCSVYISFLKKKLEVSTSSKGCLTWKCVMILTQGHSGKVKVTWRKILKFLFSPYLSYGKTLEVFTLNKDCWWPGGVSWFQHNVISASLRSSFILFYFIFWRGWWVNCAVKINIWGKKSGSV